MTASNVPGAAEGCLGSICSLTRPLVAFSTCSPQTASTFLVSGWEGDTQLDMVSVVWAAAGGEGIAAAVASAAAVRNDAAVRRGIGQHSPDAWCRKSLPPGLTRGVAGLF